MAELFSIAPDGAKNRRTMKTKNISPTSKQTSRRQFAKSVATTLIAAPFAASLAKAQTPAKKEPTAPPNPPPTPAPQKPSPVAEARSEEHTSELQSLRHLVCRLLLEKKKKTDIKRVT